MSDTDVGLYKQILRAHHDGHFKQAQKLQEKITNHILDGYILYDRYFSPRYKTKASEITAWFDGYADLAVASDMYDLGRQKKATLPPRKPKGLFGGQAGTCSAVFRPEPIDLIRGKTFSYLGSKDSSQAKSIMNKIYKNLKKGHTKTVRKLLENPQTKKLFSSLDYDQAQTALSFSYFIDGENTRAIEFIRPVLERSGKHIPQAFWVAGLTAWRQGDFSTSAKYFDAAATHQKGYPLLEASASVWAARSYLKIGAFEKVRPALERAAQYQRLFYGILAMRILAKDLGHVWDTPAKPDDDLSAEFSHPAMERFYALHQIGQKEWAGKELSKLYLEADDEAKGILLMISEQNGFSDDLLAVSGNLGDGSTRYPAPNWTPTDGWKVDKALVYAFVRQESCFNRRAESDMGAVGLMQIMPATGRELAKNLQYPFQKKLLKDPEYNLSLGQNYLLTLMQKQAVGDNLMYMATAYNAGPGNLIKWKKQINTNDPLLFLESIPSKETRSFVERIIVNYWIYRNLMNQPLASLDSVATGDWPCYRPIDCPIKQSK
ncbi:MAG: transglycosylase SLT domain-containing protein [Pseudomonadota bacterium]|nr:transglycosylase SLT domain-containing protein [Pseudomonadota bacterium]